MQQTWAQENLRLLDIIRNSELYPILKEGELSQFENISRGKGTNTQVYRVGHVTDIETGNEIYVALKQTLNPLGFVIAYHEFSDTLGLPIPAFAGGIEKEERDYLVTEDLTLGDTVKLFERNFEGEEFPNLKNKEELEEEFRRLQEIMQSYGPAYHHMDFVRTIFIQINNEDIGRLVAGDIVNIRSCLELTYGHNSQSIEMAEKLLRRCGEINQDPRYFL